MMLLKKYVIHLPTILLEDRKICNTTGTIMIMCYKNIASYTNNLKKNYDFIYTFKFINDGHFNF